MSDPNPNLILYPVFAMFLLTAAVLAHMARMRVGALSRREMSIDFYKTYDRGEEPEQLRRLTRHFVNLFELPVLFYVVVILTYVTRQVNVPLIGLAWLYVALRYVHTWVHLTSNRVATRFRVYMASGLVLLAMWSILFVQIVIAG